MGWRKIIFSIITTIGVFASTQPAGAAFILLDSPTFGPNSLVLDTSTGLEWLNVRFTAGLSPLEAIAETQPGGKFAGFQLSGLANLETLVTDFFGCTQFCADTGGDVDKATMVNFVNLFDSGDSFIAADSLGTGSDRAHLTAFEVGLQLGHIDFDFESANGIFQSFLVQPVPEPSSLGLLGTALVGFGWLRKRRGPGSIFG